MTGIQDIQIQNLHFGIVAHVRYCYATKPFGRIAVTSLYVLTL